MSLEGISKARGRYIIQAWSSCPGLILTRSQVGHMLQLNSPSPYPNVVLTNLSLLVKLREVLKRTLCSIKVCVCVIVHLSNTSPRRCQPPNKEG